MGKPRGVVAAGHTLTAEAAAEVLRAGGNAFDAVLAALSVASVVEPVLCTPGGDVESTTAKAGSGANVMLFSTGLGTPTGNAVAPVIKVATNSALAQRMPDIIDVDAGPVITGEQTIEQLGERLLHTVIETASGRYATKSQRLGQDDFMPWRRGMSF